METDRRKESLYSNKVILAPMVRVGTLPMRLLALRFGADLVYSEEIIDFKLIKSRRSVNLTLKTIDFIDEMGCIVFRTCEEEKNKVIIQIGTNDPNRAVLAAKIVENDVAGVDINMGCPKSFSIKGGMGAALLSKPDKIRDILTNLKANIKKPISCKIRVLPDLDATIELAKMIDKTGIDALAIHGRTKEERPQHQNRDHYIRAVANAVQIPVIANGGSSAIECYEDIAKFKAATNVSSVMIARAAMKNCSIFSSSKRIDDVETLIRMYLKLSIEFDNNAINSKYSVQQMLGSLQTESEKGKQFLGSYDLETMSKIYDMHQVYVDIMSERKQRLQIYSGPKNLTDLATPSQSDSVSVELPVLFDKKVFPEIESLPKSILHRWISRNGLKDPVFQTYQVDKQFHSVIHFMGKTYSTPYLEKTKRYAEQSAALVLVLAQGLCNDSNVIDKCLVTSQSSVDTLQYCENGRTYLIRINK